MRTIIHRLPPSPSFPEVPRNCVLLLHLYFKSLNTSVFVMSVPPVYCAAQPLMSEKCLSDDEEWDAPACISSECQRLGKRLKRPSGYFTQLIFIFNIIIPWMLFVSLASWNIFHHYKQADDTIIASQLIYSEYSTHICSDQLPK